MVTKEENNEEEISVEEIKKPEISEVVIEGIQAETGRIVDDAKEKVNDEIKTVEEEKGSDKDIEEITEGVQETVKDIEEARNDLDEELGNNISDADSKAEKINKEDKNESKKCPRCGKVLEGVFCDKCGANCEEAIIQTEKEKRFTNNVKEILRSEKEFLKVRAETFGISEDRLDEVLEEIEKYLITKNKENVNCYLDRRNIIKSKIDSKMGSYGLLSKTTEINPKQHNTSLDLIKTINHEFTHLALNETLFRKMNERWFRDEVGRYKTKEKLDKEYDNFIFSVSCRLDHPAFKRKVYSNIELFENEPSVEEECSNSYKFISEDLSDNIRDSYSEEEIMGAIKEEIEESLEIATEDIKESREAQHNFFSLYRALDEAAAYVGEKFVDKNKDIPDFEKYDNQTDPGIFNLFYNEFEKIAEKLNPEEFDVLTKMSAEMIAQNWNVDSTIEDCKKTFSRILYFLDNINDELYKK